MKLSSAAVAVTLSLAALPAVASAPPEPPPAFADDVAKPPPSFEDTLDVELVAVPFYAVGRDGRPVYDLRPEEVELFLDDERVELDYFDRYGSDEPVVIAGGRGTPGSRLIPTATPRHVFLLFDLAFTIPRGLPAHRQMASGLVAELPESDWIYLLTYHTQSGFQQLVGPVPATAEGKKRVIDEIAGLRPNVGRVHKYADLLSLRDADCNRCFGPDAHYSAYRDIHGMEKANYAAEARALAESLEYFATFLRQINGPRLLVYLSQGIDTRLYTEGLDKRLAPIRHAFERPLRALGESGAMVLFVNGLIGYHADLNEDTQYILDADAVLINDVPTGESALQDMATTSGGMVLQHPNAETLKDRIADWTAAYYEVGFHTSGRRWRESPRTRLVVRRPGVEAWAPRWAKTRRDYRQLASKEKRFLIADLVLHGPQAQTLEEVRALGFHRLDGSYGGTTGGAERMLTFAARWPEHLKMKAVELYSVVLAPGETLLDAQVVTYKEGIYSPSEAGSTLDVSLPAGGRYIWGIVAVDAAEGEIYLRRMVVEPVGPGAPEPTAVAESGE